MQVLRVIAIALVVSFLLGACANRDAEAAALLSQAKDLLVQCETWDGATNHKDNPTRAQTENAVTAGKHAIELLDRITHDYGTTATGHSPDVSIIRSRLEAMVIERQRVLALFDANHTG